MLQYGAERFIVAAVLGVDDEDRTLSDGELGLEAALEERGPCTQEGSVGVDLTISALQDDVRVFRIVEDGGVAHNHQSRSRVVENNAYLCSPLMKLKVSMVVFRSGVDG